MPDAEATPLVHDEAPAEPSIEVEPLRNGKTSGRRDAGLPPTLASLGRLSQPPPLFRSGQAGGGWTAGIASRLAVSWASM